MIAAGMDDEKGVVDLDPSSPSSISLGHHIDSHELISDAEFAYRFPEVYFFGRMHHSESLRTAELFIQFSDECDTARNK